MFQFHFFRNKWLKSAIQFIELKRFKIHKISILQIKLPILVCKLSSLSKDMITCDGESDFNKRNTNMCGNVKDTAVTVCML